MRYFLIDKVTELVPGEMARGVKCVSLSDEILHDHFPDYPIMPGLLVLEASAQLGGFLLEMSLNRASEPLARALLVQIEKAKFHGTAGPGDRLDVRVTMGSTVGPAVEVATEVHVGQKRIAHAALRFVMQQIDSDRVHEQRRYLYGLWSRHLEDRKPIL
jgi:3-hydroxyacyl-[acyl-carrier-protein] dehydratase